jgi:hypothetical protein
MGANPLDWECYRWVNRGVGYNVSSAASSWNSSRISG